jgi:adenine-specific DNA-methyltransferase
MQLNAEDGGHRKCILVTNNENGICENVTYERNKRVINGYTKPNGETVEGLKNNNLRYYRTGYVERQSSKENRRKLMELSTDMLCIKEDLYTEQTTFGRIKLNPKYARYFEQADNRMLLIYEVGFIKAFVEEIEKMELNVPIKVYVYSDGRYAYDHEFNEVIEKVSLCALPAAILEAIKRVTPEPVESVTRQTEVAEAPSTEVRELDLFSNL